MVIQRQHLNFIKVIFILGIVSLIFLISPRHPLLIAIAHPLLLAIFLSLVLFLKPSLIPLWIALYIFAEGMIITLMLSTVDHDIDFAKAILFNIGLALCYGLGVWTMMWAIRKWRWWGIIGGLFVLFVVLIVGVLGASVALLRFRWKSEKEKETEGFYEI